MRKFNVNVNGKIYVVEIEETGAAAPIAAAPIAAAPAAAPAPAAPAPAAPAPTTAPAPAPAAAPVSGGKVNITAPMPGTVLDVKVSVGASVKAGDVICILEAMKMENEIVASQDGVITSVATKGSTVNTGDILASME